MLTGLKKRNVALHYWYTLKKYLFFILLSVAITSQILSKVVIFNTLSRFKITKNAKKYATKKFKITLICKNFFTNKYGTF